MLFRNKAFKARVTYLVLVSMAWLTAGGPAWAEQRSVSVNPAATLRRLADDPRLALSAEQRQALREAADRPEAAELLARLADGPGSKLTAEQRRRLGLAPAAEPGCCDGAGATLSPAATFSRLADDLRRVEPAGGALSAEAENAVAAARERFTVADARARSELAAAGRALSRGGVAPEILARHQAAVADYEARAEVLRLQLAAAEGGDAGALAAAVEALASSREDRGHRAYDPAHPPFAVAEPTWREPGEPVSADAGADLASRRAASRSADGPPVRRLSEVAPALTAVPVASTPPTAADLAPTVDAPFTPQIRDLAASLGHQPLAIYDWVRNHVDFYPTWGSVQGAQRTLDMGRGNAADVSSLLVALLRASGVPARYVTGTIEVPAAEAQNWLGGAATPQVAQQILGQGGIANVGLLSGSGTLSAIRLEHVWVEAWIDNVPSRGAVQREGDTWLPLDPAFKQHAFTSVSDVFAAVPFDAVYDPTNPPFAVDESLGRITDVDTDQLDASLLAWVQDADDYILANGVEQSFDGILGGSEIVAQASTVFAGELPNRVVARNGAVSELPASLRHRVRLRAYASNIDRALGSTLFDVQLNLPELDAHRLSLSFPPATQADADVLQAARDNGATSLPVYLVDVAPTLTLDGAELARGAAVGMGSDFFLDVDLIEPGRSETVPYRVVAGDEIAVGINGNGVSTDVVEKRFAAHPVDNVAEYLHQVQLHYWAETDYLGEVAASRRGVHPLRLPSVGLFTSNLSVSYFFGVPRTAVYAGRVMDVQRSLVGAAGADPQQVLAWVRQSGLQGSYLEGSVFEQLSIGDGGGEPRPSGISSVHLITYAFSKGVPIYRITPANAAQVMPLLNLPSAVERDISSALAAGQTVLAPESAIDLGAWRGVGYILQNEQTGGGAYLISGGFAGGGILDCLRELEPVFELVLALLIILAIIALIIWLILSAPVWVPGLAGAAAAFLFFLVVWRGHGPTTAPPGTA